MATTKKEEPATSWEKRKVRVKLFKDNERYKDDVTALVNGKVWKIQRGKIVELPAYVWNVIKKGMAQDEQTAALIQEEQDAFKSREKSFT